MTEEMFCIECWAEIEPCLASLCSMRCADCRDGLTEPGECLPREARWTSAADSTPGSVNPSEPWPAWFARTQGVPA